MKVIPDDSSSANAMIEVLFYTPLHLDLALHAAPAIALFLDFFLFERQYNRRATTIFAPLLASAFTVWYGWWVERCGAKNNGICKCRLVWTRMKLTYAYYSSVSFLDRQSFPHSLGDLCRSRVHGTSNVPFVK
jgi:hypothetical protein